MLTHEDQHPITQPAWGRLDYLKITVWEPTNVIPTAHGSRPSLRGVTDAEISGAALRAI
jgi:hypothetical protein